MGYTQVESYNMSTTTLQMLEEIPQYLEAANEVKEKLIELEKKMSFYLKNSEVSKINCTSGIDLIRVSEDTLEVIIESINYSELTRGAFDITLAPVIKEWGVFSDNESVPPEENLKELISLVGYKNILIDKEKSLVGLKLKGQKIDLGAIAKGYATDKAIEIYKSYNIKSAMINLGGNVSVLGRKDNGDPWAVGIQNPENPRGDIIGALMCEDTSIVTSGNYVRNFTLNDTTYGHIIDTKSGLPINNDLTSVTVICEKAIKADALSTAIFILGREEGIQFVKDNKDISSILITKDKEVYISNSLKNNFYILDDENFKYVFF